MATAVMGTGSVPEPATETEQELVVEPGQVLDPAVDIGADENN
jgi:hypothetical protein